MIGERFNRSIKTKPFITFHVKCNQLYLLADIKIFVVYCVCHRVVSLFVCCFVLNQLKSAFDILVNSLFD